MSRSSGDLARFSLSSPPLLAFVGALASPWLCAPFPVVSPRSTAAKQPDHGEQRRRVCHSRRRGSFGARQVPKRARLDSSCVREAVGVPGEIPADLWPRSRGVAD